MEQCLLSLEIIMQPSKNPGEMLCYLDIYILILISYLPARVKAKKKRERQKISIVQKVL